MKMFLLGVTFFSCVITAWGKVFHMDRKGDAVVEVHKSDNEYKVTCKFRPQKKFDKAINAKFNDAKGDFLCRKGLMCYLNVATNESLEVLGLYSAAPVETEGERLRYSFGVPVSGCKVLKAEAKPKPPAPPAGSRTPTPGEAPDPKPTVAPKKSAAGDSETPKESTSASAKTSSYLCVVKYKEINGERKVVSRREYQRRNFKSPKEFDRFCREEFARIRARGEANLRAVRSLRKTCP